SSYEQIRKDLTQITEERAHYRSRSHKLDAELNELSDTLHARDNEIRLLRNELTDLKGQSGDLTHKRRRTEHLLEPGPSSYDPSSSTDRSESPIGFILTPAEAAQFQPNPPTIQSNQPPALTEDVTQRRRRPPTEPVTVAQADDYFRMLRSSEQPHRKPAWPIYRMLEQFRNRALAFPEADRSPVQQSVITQFYTPGFVSEYYGQPQVDAHRARQEAHRARQEAEHAAAVQRKADIKPPSLNAPDETIVRWLCQSTIEKPRKIAGILTRATDNTVSLRSIRGRRLVYARDANYDSHAIATIRYAYYLAAIEVILSPSYYKDFIYDNSILVQYPVPELSKFPGDPRNITVESVARFFAAQGLTVADIEDAALFAYVWLRDIEAVNPDVVARISLLRDRIFPLLAVHGLPAGHNENYMNSSGTIRAEPPSATPGPQIPGLSNLVIIPST
ncbi:hypothetical protein FB446DRAFT_800162, partial [Lentinula raphanica]